VAEVDVLKQAHAKKYWAFISYAHEDEVWAAWLHKTLERFRVPQQLVGRASMEEKIPQRLFPVFRDRDELPGSFDLSAKIKGSLTTVALSYRHLFSPCRQFKVGKRRDPNLQSVRTKRENLKPYRRWRAQRR
jgi:hypothetical protein